MGLSGSKRVVYIQQFGRNLRSLREFKGLTVAELASKTGIDRTRIYDLEDQETPNPTLDTLLRLQEALGLASLELLLDGIADFASVRRRAHENFDEDNHKAG